MKILLYVTGSISCYKSIELTRSLIKLGHDVKVVLSQAATEFLKLELFSYLGASGVFGPEADWKQGQQKEILHIELAKWCDQFVNFPATANTISHLAHGFTKDLGTTIFLALPEKTPKLIFPAMNTKMLKNNIIDQNVEKLSQCHNTFIMPTESGELACGEVGLGKLIEKEKALALITCWPMKKNDRSVLISTGASVSPLDDVRFLTNPASGKTGKELASSFLQTGHKVTVISGFYNTHLFSDILDHPNFSLVTAKTTHDFLNETKKYINQSDVFISSAAICDIDFNYTEGKLKKDRIGDGLSISKAPDILKEMLKEKREDQFYIGFAAEANLSEEILKKKWKQKPVDLLIGTLVSSGTMKDKSTLGFRNNEANYKIFEKDQITFEGPLSKTQLSSLIQEKVSTWQQ